MFSYLTSAFNKFIKEPLQDLGYFDRNEISRINDKHIPGLELKSTSEYLREYDYDSIKSTCFHNSIGFLYKLKYGEIGTRVLCKSSPIVHFTSGLRFFSDLSGFELISMAAFDIDRHKLDKWNVGYTMIAGNISCQLKLDGSRFVFSTRHRIHPRFVSLTETISPYNNNRSVKSTVALGFEWEVNSRTILEVMFSHFHPPSFAIQYQCPSLQCLVRVSGDVYSKKTGVSFAFHPFSFV